MGGIAGHMAHPYELSWVTNGKQLISFFEQAKTAAEAGADIILLDNMSCEELIQSIELISGRSKTEASGGITMDTVREIAETGVDYISIGALTHSAPAVDIGFDFDQLS